MPFHPLPHARPHYRRHRYFRYRNRRDRQKINIAYLRPPHIIIIVHPSTLDFLFAIFFHVKNAHTTFLGLASQIFAFSLRLDFSHPLIRSSSLSCSSCSRNLYLLRLFSFPSVLSCFARSLYIFLSLSFVHTLAHTLSLSHPFESYKRKGL